MAEKRSDVKKKRKRKAKGLRVIRPNVAGIDVGSKEHYVCCPPTGDEKRNVRDDIKVLEADKGEYMGFARMVARRKEKTSS